MKLSKKLLLTSAVLVTPLALVACGNTNSQKSAPKTVKRVHVVGTKKPASPVKTTTVKKHLENNSNGAKQQTATTNNDAINKVDNDAIMSSGLPVVNLGHGVKGEVDSGAGQKYVTFQMGHWTVTVHGNDVNEKPETAQKEATHLLDFFQTHSLPIPHDHGKIMFNVDGQTDSSIAWQEGKKVNKFSGDINHILQEAMATK